ncbi:hypothetical protein [Kitasatospora sp. NPDC098663]|uniref:hypothetical protein n=1 Tax=Kitasatospora sp. NPDC098663 TaxID=3364096 RepID=UPI00381E0365
MSPLTRNRAYREGAPGPSAATCYAQRASAAVFITEGSQPSPTGQGFVRTPGLHGPEQAAGLGLRRDLQPSGPPRPLQHRRAVRPRRQQGVLPERAQLAIRPPPVRRDR